MSTWCGRDEGASGRRRVRTHGKCEGRRSGENMTTNRDFPGWAGSWMDGYLDTLMRRNNGPHVAIKSASNRLQDHDTHTNKAPNLQLLTTLSEGTTNTTPKTIAIGNN